MSQANHGRCSAAVGVDSAIRSVGADAAWSLERFQEKSLPSRRRGGIRFSVRKCDNAKMPERFLFPTKLL
jgi:hypothetical protein